MDNFSADPLRNRKPARSLRESMSAGNGSSAPTRTGPRDAPAVRADDWGAEAPADELEQTSTEENAGILASLRADGHPAGGTDPAEFEKMQGENEQLRGIIDELRQQLEEATAPGQDGWAEREREFEAMLEEKSERIRELHVHLKELEENATAPAPKGGSNEVDSRASVGENPKEEELLALSDELERERCQLEQERRTMEEDRHQLREDEEAMMRQMREMELQMAKERAELARQRNELQRLHSEIRHELELAQRDQAVNERLKLLQRRSQQDLSAGKDSSGETQLPVRKKSMPGTAAPPNKSKQSLFGRFLGGDK